MRYQRISADCHIDLPWIPPDLFTANASAALKERMPFVKDGPDGPYWTAQNGSTFGLVNGVGPAGHKYVAGKHHRVDVMAATGLYEDGKKGIRRPTDPELRAKDMDRDGVQTPRSSTASSARPRGSTTTRRPTRCSTSTTTGSWTSAATTRTASSAWPACPTATSTPR